ncbi:MAG TPA: ATP-grasp domain-containing protein [Rubrivivax sp.]|nr:ATP-grasp domain-containing protein [Burkholderiales bacterium]HNT37737.1 ATP-grasp domain-containing protein [Rubrivivax sp.]
MHHHLAGGAAATSAEPRVGLFFNFDWDALGMQRQGGGWHFDEAGFDLFSFPSKLRLLAFDLRRFAAAQARRGRRRGWVGVSSQHEQFGALAAALVAEALGLPGTRPEAVLAAQHKLHARRVLQQVAPEANLGFAPLNLAYGEDVPEGLPLPAFVKPVKAAFSVLARAAHSRGELQAQTRFGRRELWIIRRLVEPFEQVARERLPGAGTAHALLLEELRPASTPQYNLDGWVFEGRAHALGVVDAVMVPGTQAFMRWELRRRGREALQARALDVAQRFLSAIGFTHGLFNMEFFHDAASDRLSVIEFNPRMASQFSDLYLRVQGVDPHAIALALALGRNPATLPRIEPVAEIAASLVYRSFPGEPAPPMPTRAQRAQLLQAFPGAPFFVFPRSAAGRARDEKWLGSWRYGVVHLHARDEVQLRERALCASRILGWRAPYADRWAESAAASVAPGPVSGAFR